MAAHLHHHQIRVEVPGEVDRNQRQSDHAALDAAVAELYQIPFAGDNGVDGAEGDIGGDQKHQSDGQPDTCHIQKIHGDSSLLQKVVAVQAPAIYRLDSVTGQLCYIVFKLRMILAVSFVGGDVPERLVEMIFGVALAVETFIAEA